MPSGYNSVVRVPAEVYAECNSIPVSEIPRWAIDPQNPTACLIECHAQRELS